MHVIYIKEQIMKTDTKSAVYIVKKVRYKHVERNRT